MPEHRSPSNSPQDASRNATVSENAVGAESSAEGSTSEVPLESPWAVFRTRQSGDPLDSIRTCGSVGLARETPRDEGWGREGFALVLETGQRVAVLPEPTPLPVVEAGDDARHARGKTAYVSPVEFGFTLACYQTTDGGEEAELVACGNSTAASGAFYRAVTGGPFGPAWLELPGRQRLRVDLETASLESAPRETGTNDAVDAGVLLKQTWRKAFMEVAGEQTVAGRRCAACVGPLNDYVVVAVREGESIEDFRLSDALAVWEAFEFNARPLRARMAVVEAGGTGAMDRRKARFFTCGSREHPSAPLTGLAVLLLADRRLDWLGWSKTVTAETPAGRMSMPELSQVKLEGNRVSADVALPPTWVALDWRRRPGNGLARTA